MIRDSFTTKRCYWLALFIFLIAVTARLVPGPRTIDDSFITYRYARNILSGNGFVYNPGERVLGTTTPLYTMLLVGSGFVTGSEEPPFAAIALTLNAFADGITCLLLFLLGRQFKAEIAGIGAALVWAIAPFSVTFAIGGLETSLYILLLVATIYAHIQNRHFLTSFLAALAFLTRPDALILIGPIALDRLIQILGYWRQGKQNHIPYRSLLWEACAFLIPTMLWFGFAFIYFGSPLPHSITAKTIAYRLSSEEGFIRLIQHYATPFLGHKTFGIPWIGVGIILYPFLFSIGALKSFRITKRAWPFLAYPWLYFLTFSIANPLIFRWYLTPPLPAYFLTILVGMQSLITDFSVWVQKKTLANNDYNKIKAANLPTQVILITFVVLAPVLLSLSDWTLKPDHGLEHPAPKMAWYKLELLYHQAAEILAPAMEDSSKRPVLAAGDVGVLGFHTPSRILDTVGLNSPQTVSYYPLDPALYVINYAVSPDLILDYQPDFIVILEVYGRAGLLQDPRFWQAYTLREKLPTDIYGSDGMLLFEKK